MYKYLIFIKCINIFFSFRIKDFFQLRQIWIRGKKFRILIPALKMLFYAVFNQFMMQLKGSIFLTNILENSNKYFLDFMLDSKRLKKKKNVANLTLKNILFVKKSSSQINRFKTLYSQKKKFTLEVGRVERASCIRLEASISG